MPANPKYLSSKLQRFLKTTAAIIGGLAVSSLFHVALATWINHVNVITTGIYTVFTLWVILMIVAFMSKNGWKIWGVYLTFSLVFIIICYLGKTYNPHLLNG